MEQTCTVCGTSFIPKDPRTIYCSPACRKKAENKRAKDRLRETSISKDVIKKAVAPYKTAIVEKVIPHETGELPGWEHIIEDGDITFGPGTEHLVTQGDLFTDIKPGKDPQQFHVKMEQDWSSQTKAVKLESDFMRLMRKYDELAMSTDPEMRLKLIDLYQEVLDSERLTPMQRTSLTDRIRSYP